MANSDLLNPRRGYFFRCFVFLITITVFSSLLAGAQTFPPVPSAFQSTVTLLNGQISSFDASVRQTWNGAPYPVAYAPQLIAASSDQFTQLLNANYYSNMVTPQLQAFQAVGSKAVTVHIDFPILYPAYYSSQATYQSYVAFYQQLAQDIHSRGMKMVVEACTATPFVGNTVGNFATYAQSLDWNTYMAGRAQNVVNILQQVQPDYVSVITEPDTEANNTKQTNAGTIAGATQLLSTITTAIQTAGGTNIPIGAGAGTWLAPSYNAPLSGFIQSFAALPIQYIDLHIYEINQGTLMAAITAAQQAHSLGKQVAISEAWPNKTNDSEATTMSLTAVSARNAFSFWEPVDIAFFQAISDFAQANQLLFVSPFWIQGFFSNLDYNVYGSLPDNTVLTDWFAAATNGYRTPYFGPTATGWENATVAGMPDSQAPALPSVPSIYIQGTTGLGVTWATSTDNVGVAGYNLYRNGTLIATAPAPGFYDSGLVSGGTYTYTVTAFDAEGNVSPLSAPLVASTINTTPPTVPTNVTATALSKSSISLNWSPSTDIGGVAGYRIYRGKTPTSLSPFANVTSGTCYTDTMVAANTTYYYQVAGYIASGLTGAFSATASATTLAH